MEQVNILMQH